MLMHVVFFIHDMFLFQTCVVVDSLGLWVVDGCCGLTGHLVESQSTAGGEGNSEANEPTGHA